VAHLTGFFFGAGIAVSGADSANAKLVGEAIMAGSLLAAARWRWSARQARVEAPAWTRIVSLGVAGALAGVVVSVFGPALPDLLSSVARQPGAEETLLILIAAAIVSAPFNARYAWHRQNYNREIRGIPARPWLDAAWSSWWAFMVTGVNNVVQLASLPEIEFLYAQYFVAPAFIAGFLGYMVQRRVVGAVRIGESIFAGLSATSAAFVLHEWPIVPDPYSLANYGWANYAAGVLPWLLVAWPWASLADYGVYNAGRLGRWLTGRLKGRADQEADVSPKRIRRQRGLAHWQVDFERIGPPDWRVSVLKLDGPFTVLLTYLVIVPWPGFHEGVWTASARIVLAAGLAIGAWRLRDAAEERLKEKGYISSRSMTSRAWPLLLPGVRIRRQIRSYRRVLDEFLTVASQQGSERDRELTPVLAADVAKLLASTVTTPHRRRCCSWSWPRSLSCARPHRRRSVISLNITSNTSECCPWPC
jgi:hypothetical protein